MSEIDRRRAILEGALRVFSQHGFHKASIKMIAREAGIKSSALIYHYFDDKKALLDAIIRELSPLGDLPILNEGAEFLDVPPNILLPQMILRALSMDDQPEMVGLLRLFLSEAVRMPEVADAVRDLQQTAVRMLSAYLQRQIELGNLKPHDVQSAAVGLIGMMLANVMGKHIFPGLGDHLPDRELYAQQITAIFLDGLRRE